MRGKGWIAGAAAVLAVAGLCVAGGSAVGAADGDFLFYGDAAGARINALNSTVTSSISAEAGVFGGPSPEINTNHAAAARLQGVATLGTVNTSGEIKSITGGWEVVATAQTAGINLLNGAIKATAITTTATITEVNNKLSANVSTDFVGLHIVGVNVPTHIPPNFAVKLGNIAQVGINTGTWNVQNTGDPSTTVARAIGAGLQVRLLEPAGSAETGASIYVSPVDTMVGPHGNVDTGHTTLGIAYGSKVTANVGTLVGIRSDPTAPVTVFSPGTSGHTTTNSIAAVHLGSGLQLGAITDTGFGQNTTAGATTVMTSRVANLNLFNGLIKASAITTNATASSNGTVGGQTQFVDLVIAGKPINLNVGPNTTINVLHLGQVTLNQQIRTAHGIIVRAVDIVVGTRRNGLPVGAEVQLAVSAASAT
jgi:hypothetical protein